MQDITICVRHFKTNLCAINPIPAMVHQCASWETCANRDPTTVGHLKVGAETIAEMLDSFVESMSWKMWISIPIPKHEAHIMIFVGCHPGVTFNTGRIQKHVAVVKAPCTDAMASGCTLRCWCCYESEIGANNAVGCIYSVSRMRGMVLQYLFVYMSG